MNQQSPDAASDATTRTSIKYPEVWTRDFIISMTNIISADRWSQCCKNGNWRSPSLLRKADRYPCQLEWFHHVLFRVIVRTLVIMPSLRVSCTMRTTSSYSQFTWIHIMWRLQEYFATFLYYTRWVARRFCMRNEKGLWYPAQSKHGNCDGHNFRWY